MALQKKAQTVIAKVKSIGGYDSKGKWIEKLDSASLIRGIGRVLFDVKAEQATNPDFKAVAVFPFTGKKKGCNLLIISF